MTSFIQVDLRGHKKLQRKLAELDIKALQKIARKATSKAMTPVAREVRRRAPREEGVLRKSIGKRTKVSKKSGSVSSVVGPKGSNYLAKNGRPSNLPHLLEFGHKGAPPNPFMRAAFESKRKEAERVFISVLQQELKKLKR